MQTQRGRSRIIIGKVGTGVDQGAKRRREVVGRVTVASDTTS